MPAQLVNESVLCIIIACRLVCVSLYLSETPKTAMSALDLPTLDLSETDLNVLGQQFRTAGETTGFMQIVNHGVPPELMSRAFDQAEKFFKLPLEEVSILPRLRLAEVFLLIMEWGKIEGQACSGSRDEQGISDDRFARWVMRHTLILRSTTNGRSDQLSRGPSGRVTKAHISLRKLRKR